MLFGRMIVPMLGVLTVTALMGHVALAGTASAGVDKSASLRLASTGHISAPLKGFARLQLLNEQGAGPSLRASAQVESDGLTENRLYDLWVTTREGKSILLDTGRADEECEEDCETIVSLRGHLLEAPSNLTALEGLTIDISEHFSVGLFGSGAAVVATGTVASSDLPRVIVNSGPSRVSTGTGDAFEDLPDAAATIGFGSIPPSVDKIIRPQSREEDDEDEETRLREEEEEQSRA